MLYSNPSPVKFKSFYLQSSDNALVFLNEVSLLETTMLIKLVTKVRSIILKTDIPPADIIDLKTCSVIFSGLARKHDAESRRSSGTLEQFARQKHRKFARILRSMYNVAKNAAGVLYDPIADDQLVPYASQSTISISPAARYQLVSNPEDIDINLIIGGVTINAN